MKQLGLPFRRNYWKSFFKVVSIAVGVALIATILMYFFIKLRNDDIVQYFPKDTEFFVSFKLDSAVLESVFFDRLLLPAEIKEEIRNLTQNNLNQKAKRNVGFGLIPVDGELLPVSIIFLEQEIDSNHSLLSLIAQHNLAASKIDNSVYNKHYVILANEKKAVDAIARVIENQLPSLNDTLQFNIQRQFISQERGLLYMSEKFIGDITRKMSNGALLESPVEQKIVAGFDIINDTVQIRTENYEDNQSIKLPEVNELDFTVSAYQPLVIFEKFMTAENIEGKILEYERQNNLILGEFLSKVNISRATYGKIDDNRDFMMVKTDDKELLVDFLRQWLVETLANKRQKIVTHYLPDGSSIQTLEKNRDDIYIDDQGRVRDDVEDDVYYLFPLNGDIVMAKNISSEEFTLEELQDCDVHSESDVLLVNNTYIQSIPYLGGVIDKAIFSTYPQGYPQILVCLQ